MGNSTAVIVRIRGLGKGKIRIGSAMEVALGEVGIGSVGGQMAKGVDQRGGSSLTTVVEYSCLHRT